MSIFTAMRKFFIYSEPKIHNLGFELLEGDDEGALQPPNQTQTNQNTQNSGLNNNQMSKGGNKKAIKPLGVNEWNKSRKGDGENQNLSRNQAQNRNKTQNNNQNKSQSQHQSGKKYKSKNQNTNSAANDSISSDLSYSLNVLQEKFGVPKNEDIVFRKFKIGKKLDCFMVYVEGMIDKNSINLSMLPELMSKDILEDMGNQSPVDFLIETVIPVHNLKKESLYGECIKQVLSGASVLFVQGCTDCIVMETRGYEKRSVESPKTEMVVMGAQEAFTENLRTNLTLVRRILKTQKLVTELIPAGDINNTMCAVLYLDGVANPKVVQEVIKRIKRIKTDLIIGSGMVEQFIEDRPLMLFPQVLTTERPDRTASFIMDGQVVIITEGAPFSMAVPVTFFRLLHTSEDSFTRWPFGTFLRLLRLFGLFCATLLPGLYVAMVMFHPEMIPTELLASIVKSKELVPFPTLLEVLIMEIAFELIREGGIRIPSIIGQTLGIVGALILGQAAVSAGLVSPMLVIIVSVTALGSFAIPNYSMGLAIRIERFFFIIAGAFLGFFGIAFVIFALGCVTCSIKSFGVPFLSPVAPKTKSNHDIILRTPIWMQDKRPDPFQTANRQKQGKNVKDWALKEEPKQKGDNNNGNK